MFALEGWIRRIFEGILARSSPKTMESAAFKNELLYSFGSFGMKVWYIQSSFTFRFPCVASPPGCRSAAASQRLVDEVFLSLSADPEFDPLH